MGSVLAQRSARAGRPLILSGVDSNFSDVSLLLPLDGADGATSVSDASNDARSITVVGNAQIDTDQSKWGGSSLLLDGTGDYLTTANDATLIDPSGNLSFQVWARPSSMASTMTLFSTRDESQSNEGFWFTINSNGALSLAGFSENGSSQVLNVIGTVSQISANVWHYLQLIKTGTTWKGYVNGTENFSVTETGQAGQGSSLFSIGRMERAAGNLEFAGHLDDLRLTNGVARTPSVPTAAHPTS